MTRRRITLVVLVAVALLGLATTVTWAAVAASGRPAHTVTGNGPGMMGGADSDDQSTGSGYGRGSYGPGMMGGGYGPGMMGSGGYGSPGDGRQVATMEAARARAQAFADRLRLRAGEVMQFSNGFYSELLTTDGAGATEVLVDQATGAVGIEYGPAMTWNTRYGVHPVTGAAPAVVSAEEATRTAQRWLDGQRPGLTTGEPEAFPGYYTLHTLHDGKIVGMLSVNATTGSVWYHTWHGTFVAMIGE